MTNAKIPPAKPICKEYPKMIMLNNLKEIIGHGGDNMTYTDPDGMRTDGGIRTLPWGARLGEGVPLMADTPPRSPGAGAFAPRSSLVDSGRGRSPPEPWAHPGGADTDNCKEKRPYQTDTGRGQNVI